MNSSSFKASAPTVLLTLGMTFCLGGCQSLTTTRTAGIEADKAVTAGVCRVWVPITYSSRDTDQTRLEVRGNNAARGEYCGEVATPQ